MHSHPVIMQTIHCYLVPEGASEDPDGILENDPNYPKNAVYTSIRTYNSRAFEIDHHLIRLKKSAKIKEFVVSPTMIAIRQHVERLIEESSEETQFLKITVTPNHLVIISRPLHVDESIYSGVSVVTKNLVRHDVFAKSFPDAKIKSAYQEAHESGHHDVLLVNNEGLITEGSRSNLLWIQGNKLFYCTDALKGVTQANVLRCFKQLQSENPELKLEKSDGLPIDELDQVDEIFITQTSRGLIPVGEVNGMKIGDGHPGPQTKVLLEAFRKLVIERSS